MSDAEYIDVTYGEEKYAPVQYNSMQAGPYSIRTKVRPGETPEQAFERAYRFLEAQARRAWPGKLRAYLERMNEAGKAARDMREANAKAVQG